MTKAVYVGVEGKARKVKKGYIGVGGKARKIKKAYVGVGGVARPFWGGGELAYYGLTSDLSQGRHQHAAATIGGRALFAGGGSYASSWTYYSSVETYNEELTKGTATSLAEAKRAIAGTMVGDYAIFGGGLMKASFIETARNTVDAYNSSLTKSVPTAFAARRAFSSATSVGDYAIFAGGQSGTSDSSQVSSADVYDKSLVRTQISSLIGTTKPGAASNGTHALIGGGAASDGFILAVKALDTSLTMTALEDLPGPTINIAAAAAGDNVIFFCGESNDETVSQKVSVYNASLTRSDISHTGYARTCATPLTFENYALFAGGFNSDGDPYGYTSSYDDSLVSGVFNLTYSMANMQGATVGNYGLFSGGTQRKSGRMEGYYSVFAFTIV